MRKAFLLLALIGSASLLASCGNGEEGSSSLSQGPSSSSEAEESFFLKIAILEGEGIIRLFKDGNEVTEDNFASLVSPGDTVTVEARPGKGEHLLSLTLDGDPLSPSGRYYTFLAKEGENLLEARFALLETDPTDFTFRVKEDGTAEILSYAAPVDLPSPVLIPDEVLSSGEMIPVTSLGEGVFRNLAVDSVKLGKNVSSLTGDSFLDAGSLEEILVDEENPSFSSLDGVLFQGEDLVRYPIAKEGEEYVVPSGTRNVLAHAFEDVGGLARVTLPEGVLSLGEECFASARGLREISFPEGLQSIGDMAFSYTSSLEEVVLPEGLLTLGEGSFYSTAAKKASFPSTLKEIGSRSFYFARSLREIDLAEGLETIGEEAFISTPLASLSCPSSLLRIEKSAFELCSSLTSLSLNEGLLYIGDVAFGRANYIASVHLPSTLEEVGINPFQGVTTLGREGTFTIEEDNPYLEIRDGVLYSKGEEPALLIYPYALSEDSFLIPEGVSSLAQDSFCYQSFLKEVTIPRSVTSIHGAFRSMYLEASGGNEGNALRVNFLGTMEEWASIDLHGSSGEWHEDTSIEGALVHCSDGDVLVA